MKAHFKDKYALYLTAVAVLLLLFASCHDWSDDDDLSDEQAICSCKELMDFSFDSCDLISTDEDGNEYTKEDMVQICENPDSVSWGDVIPCAQTCCGSHSPTTDCEDFYSCLESECGFGNNDSDWECSRESCEMLQIPVSECDMYSQYDELENDIESQGLCWDFVWGDPVECRVYDGYAHRCLTRDEIKALFGC